MADPTTPADRAALITISESARQTALAEAESVPLTSAKHMLTQLLAELDAQRRARFEDAEVLRVLMADMSETFSGVDEAVARIRAEVRKHVQ